MDNEIAIVRKTFPDVQVVIPTERYKYLLDDLKSILVQRVKNARMESVQAWWEVGERIQQELVTTGMEEYKDLVVRVAKDLATSYTEIYRGIEFYNKFPSWEAFLAEIPEGDNISWNMIKTKYLPDLPAANIPLIIPKLEMDDIWGITKWWIANETGAFILIVNGTSKSKDKQIKLMVKRVKEVESTPFKEAFREIDNCYISAKGWSMKDLDAHDFQRMHKAVKHLLIKAKGDVGRVKEVITWCANKYKSSDIDWGLETCIKKWPEAMKPGNTDKYSRFDKKIGGH